MGRLFLNTYAALVATPAGREASKRFGLPPFIDGSIRREPDLEAVFGEVPATRNPGALHLRLLRPLLERLRIDVPPSCP